MPKSTGDAMLMDSAAAVCDSFRCLLKEWLAGKTEFIPAIEAEKFLAEVDAALLDDWLHALAHSLVTDAMSALLRSDRAIAFQRSEARAFASAAGKAAEGDYEPLAHFKVAYVVDTENTRRRVADMTGDDHRFVADSYDASGRYDLLIRPYRVRSTGRSLPSCAASRPAESTTLVTPCSVTPRRASSTCLAAPHRRV